MSSRIIWLKQALVAGSCECGNKPSGCKEDRHFTLAELILASQGGLGTIWFINSLYHLYAFILIILLEIWQSLILIFLVSLVEYSSTTAVR
jgi:hypothetical protein